MSEQIHSDPVQHPSAWYGRDLMNDPAWLVHLTQQDLAEIAAAVRGVKAHGLALGEVGRGNFPLPTLAAKAGAMAGGDPHRPGLRAGSWPQRRRLHG